MSIEIIRGGQRPGSIPGQSMPADMPRRGRFHADEFDGTPSQARAQAARLDSKWAAWSRTMSAAAISATLHIDVGETVFFLRELAEIKAKAYDVKYATLKARTLIPVIGGDPGAETFIFSQFNYAGTAKRINASAQDFPRVNANGQQFINPYNSYGVSFDYTIPELRAAMKAGRSIEALRATAARMALLQTQDSVMSLGDVDADNGSGGSSPMQGLLSFSAAGSGAQSFAVPQVNGSSVWIGNKTPDEIIADVNLMISAVPNGTRDVEHVKRVLIPVLQYNYIKSTKRTAYSNETILESLHSAWEDEGVEFVSWNRLAGAGANAASPGTAPYDMMVGYDPDEDHIWCPVSIEYQQMAPQLEKMRFAVYCEMRMGGVVSPYPASMIFGSGI